MQTINVNRCNRTLQIIEVDADNIIHIHLGLSSREREVLRFIALGETNKSMADILKISVKTIEKFRTSMMRKLGIHDIASLTHYALANGVCGNKFGGNQ